MKDELGGKILDKFFWLREKTYSYQTDDSSKDKKAKCTKNVFHKKENIIDVDIFEKNKLILKTRQRLKTKSRNVFTE